MIEHRFGIFSFLILIVETDVESRVQIAPPHTRVCAPLPAAVFDDLVEARKELARGILRTVGALGQLDARLCRYYSERTPTEGPSRGLAAAVRAAAPCVEFGSDWEALLMLCRERGIDLTETQLHDIVRREAPKAPLSSRQALQNAWWDTRRRRFPQWEPAEGMTYKKFKRHYRVAAAAFPMLPPRCGS